MITDFDSDAAASSLNCDVCVVGGGAVGLALAVTLADAGVDVLVLEGGGQTLESRSQALQRGESVGHPFPNIDVGRYRVLGGTTTFWGGQVVPFDRFVTSARPWAGHTAWPIDPQELERYFQHAYALLGLADAELDDDKVWGLLGTPKPALGDRLEMVMTRWLKTRNFSKLFAKQLQSPTGPRVLTHANVVALRLQDDRKSVRSLAVRSLKGKTGEVTAKRFVLASGSLEITRLLLHPLADGSNAPWSDSAHLGTPLIDHLDCIAGEVEILDHRRFRELFDNIFVGGHKYYPKMRLAPVTQREEGLVDIAAQFRYKTRFSEHLEYLKMFVRSLKEGGVPKSVGSTDRWVMKMLKVKEGEGHVSLLSLPGHIAAVFATSLPLALRYFKDRRSFKPRDAEVSLGFFCEQLPTSRSRIQLGDQTDELGLRRIRVDWQIDGRELATMRRFGMLIKEEFEQQGLATVTLDPRLVNEDPAFTNEIFDAIHQMGSTRMGRSTEDGFVDADLKVFGIDNLFIAGSTVFPSTGFANPTFTAIALSLRLGRHLSGAARAVA
ncbi:GMC family oxidoreductase [Methylibium sp.]|uniref:GMC family oxidoreductase n=1 Tax=Methylibium sp. TaxID=2067992 RepID=UPI003D0FD12D